MNITQNTETDTGTNPGRLSTNGTTGRTFTARRALIAILVAFAALLAAPVAAQAAVGVAATAGTGTLPNPVNFGTTAQGLLPRQITIFHWNNTSFQSTSSNFTITGSAYRRNGGSCSGTPTGQSWTSTRPFTAGSTNCSIILELIAGTPVGTPAGTLAFTSGAAISGTSSFTLTGVVEANNPVIQIWNSANSAEQTLQTFPDTLSGTNSATYLFTMRNAGNLPLTNPSTQSITGADASSFTITATTCGATLGVGATCTVTTRFNPPGAVTTVVRNATLNITPTFGGNPFPDTVSLSGNALAQTRIPALFNAANVTPLSSFDFGPIGVGAQANQTFTLRNTGNWPMAGPNIQSLTGANAAEFSITSTTCGATIAAGGNCQISVRFEPVTAGPLVASLNVTPSDATSGSPAVISFTGFGVPPTFIPELFDTPGTTLKPSHVFPDTVGTFQSAPYVYTLRNTGNAILNGVGVANQAITGPDAGQFNISATTCGASLNGGQSCTISVRFEPTSAAPDPGGLKNATLTVTTSNGVPVSASSSISGTAIPATRVPEIFDTAGTTLKPSHAFPDTVGTLQSAPYVFTLRNTGNSTMTGTGTANQAITGPNAAEFNILATTCGTTLATGASCTVSVRFNPNTEAPTPASLKTATLSVNTTNGIPATASSTLSGTSIPAISSPEIRDTGNATVLATQDLGSSAVGELNQYVFTIRNNGNVNLNGAVLSRQIISGPDAAQFSRSTTCGAVIAANATCTMTVSFAPSSVGPKSATLRLGSVNGDPVLDPIIGDPGAFYNTQVTLSGTGVAPNPSIGIFDTAGTTELTSRDYGNVNVGSPSAYVFTLKNTGNVAVPNIVQTVTGLQASAFVRTTTCAASLPRDASCTVTVTATTTRTGLRRARLTVTPGAASPQAGPKSVDLSAESNGLIIRNDVGDNLSNTTQKRWLDTIGMGGAAPTGDTISVAFEVDQGRNQTIEDVLISNTTTTNDTAPADGTFSPIPGGIGKVVVQRKPASPQALVMAQVPVSAVGPGVSIGSYGFGDGVACFFHTATSDNRRVWFQIRDQSGVLSAKVGSIVRFTDARYACGGGPILSSPQITSIGGVTQPANTQNAVVDVNENFNVSVEGYTRNNAYTGLLWRVRNTKTGDIFVRNGANTAYVACADPCTGGGQLLSVASSPRGTVQAFTVPGMPSRGRWVVEGSPRGDGQDNNRIFRIATVLANSKVTDSPDITLSGTPVPRPNTNSAWNLVATVSDTANASGGIFDTQGGRAQTIEWDLNNNQTDGPAGDGFEVRYDGDVGTNLTPEELTQAFTTAGKTPGPYTIRARITDNGAMLSNDASARSKIVSTSFTINSPPVANSDTFDFEADDSQPRSVPFVAVDADSDPYTVNVTPNPGNAGSVAGAGNTKNYTWPATFTGNDQFPFTATDDKLGTGPVGTLTIRVRPNTRIDVATPNGSNPIPASGYLGASNSTDAEFNFSSPQTPVVAYECRRFLDGILQEDWAPCAAGASGTMDYAGLADGLQRFEVRAINADGQRDGTPTFRTWRVDTTVPVTSLRITPPSDTPAVQPRPTNDPTPSYAFEVADRSPQEFVTYECRILSGPDSGIWKPCASPSSPAGSGLVTFAGPGSDFGYPDPFDEGIYNVEVRATDDVGLTGPVLAESFRVDLTPPVTSIASGPDGLINYRDVNFEVTSTEASSTFTCQLVGDVQGVVFPTGFCPGGSSPSFPGLADDSYTLVITAIDPATNLDPNPPVAEFEIDATEPTTSGGAVDFGEGVTLVRRTQSRRITVDFAGFDVRQLQGFQCRLDSTDADDWTTCQPPETYGGLIDGDHRLEIRSRDEASNVDSSPLVIDWTIDRTPPVTTIDVGPPAGTNDSDPQIEFSVNEGATSECRIDSGAWSACSSPVWMSSLAGGPLTDGPHTFDVRSTDIALNAETTPASSTWSQDTVLPVVEIVGAPAPFVPQGDAEFGWTVKDGTPPALAPELDSECQLDAGPWQLCARTLTVPAPSNGVHAMKIRSTDAAGNVSAEAVHNWEVLGEPPVAPSIDNSDPPDGTVTRFGAATFAFSTVSEALPSFGTYECRVDDNTWSACESPFQVNGLGDGAHEFQVRAKDQAGNISPVTSAGWEVQSAAPVTTFNSAPSGLTRQRSASITFASSKPGTFECRLDDAAWAACASPQELTDLSDGLHSFRVRAVSSVAPFGVKDPTPPSRSWTVDSTTPDTTIDTAPTGTIESRDAQITFSSDDPEAGFQCKLDDAVFDSCSSPLNLSSLAFGARTIVVRAIDAAGNTDGTPEERSWTIVAPPPVLCPPGTQGTPPDCTPIPPVVGDQLTATLSTGELSLAALGSVPLPASQLVLTGALDEDGKWGVPQGGVNFLPVEQTLDAPGIGQVTVKISITATGPGTGTLSNGGGAATFNLPVQAKLEASLGGIPLIGPSADCFLRPIQFTLTGTYDETARTATVGSEGVTFPQVSAGCGPLGGTVNGLLELPRSDIGISLTFDLVKTILQPNLAKPVIKAPKSVRSGKPITISSQITNTGTGTATGVKVCLNSPTKLVRGKAQRCSTVASIAPGQSATVRFRVVSKAGKKGKKAKKARFTIDAAYQVSGQTKHTKTGHVTLLK